ncbi:MAG TPA: hypothetical protein PKB06_11155 [Actinotalea sp.]|nr:hypothetical protein [Actinotalea sp.]
MAATRLVVKSVLGIGRDFLVSTPDGAEVAFVDGKLGVRPKADVQVPVGTVALVATGQVLGIQKRLTITRPDGSPVAEVKAALFSPLRSRITTTLADGRVWELAGNLIEKEYAISAGADPVARITQKWVTVRDTYTVDVTNPADVPLVLAVVWAVDAFREQK